MTSSISLSAAPGNPKKAAHAPGKTFLMVAGLIFAVAAAVFLVFGILGFLGVGITDNFYLDITVNESRALSKNIDGVAMFTDESWEIKADAEVRARVVLNDITSTQEQINSAIEGLRAALDSLVLTEEFAGYELDEFIPDTRGIPVLFTYLIILSAVFFVSGFLALKHCASTKKTKMLGVFGVINFFATLVLVLISVDTLGHEMLYSFAVIPSAAAMKVSAAIFVALALLPSVLYIIGVFRNDRRTHIIIVFSILALLSMVVLFPLFWIIRTSLMYVHEVASMAFLPPSWLFSNYPRALESFRYFTYLRNTFIIVTPAVILGTCTAILCAYSFARLRFRFKRFVFGLCIASMMLPSVVTLIPLYIMFTNFFDFSDSFWPLIIPWICGGGAFNIFLMRQFIMTVPRELDEAAMIDGAGRLRILVQILMPSIKPAIMVVGIFIFMLIWNDLLTQTIYLQNDELYTMAIGLRVFTGSYGTHWPFTMVATVLSIIPGILIYIFGQKYLVEGIVMTGMKN